MKASKGIYCYLLGAWLQIGIVCLLMYILEKCKVQYPQGMKMIFLAIGGTSSALWGIVIAKKTGRIKDVREVLKDFFAIKQRISDYILVLLFIGVDFGWLLISGKMINGVSWYHFFIYFGIAIIFGGIEEIGWRYTLGPLLRKYISYELTALCCFVGWAIWHYMYFYLVGSLQSIVHINFLLGLLSSCFILAAIYEVSGSLWLCVLYHCLLNTFSQTLLAVGTLQTVITTTITICIAIIVVKRKKSMDVEKVKVNMT